MALWHIFAYSEIHFFFFFSFSLVENYVIVTLSNPLPSFLSVIPTHAFSGADLAIFIFTFPPSFFSSPFQLANVEVFMTFTVKTKSRICSCRWQKNIGLSWSINVLMYLHVQNHSSPKPQFINCLQSLIQKNCTNRSKKIYFLLSLLNLNFLSDLC